MDLTRWPKNHVAPEKKDGADPAYRSGARTIGAVR